MKGIVLAGGLGKRMRPLTKEENKHYLPIYKSRMIEYPVQTLVDMGIKDIVLITGGQKAEKFFELFRDGSSFGIDRLYYTYQEGSGGISDALSYAQPFLEPDESCTVILGDNYFEDVPEQQELSGAQIFLQKTETPWHFGIAEVSGDQVINIEEKPSKPQSDLAVVGLYQFDSTVWDKISKIELSARGELEITDLLNLYIEEGTLGYQMYNGYWSDMGTFQSWMKVSQRVASRCI